MKENNLIEADINHIFSITEIDQSVFSEYPYPIAVNYKRIFEEESWERRTRQMIVAFEYTLRTIALIVLSQYILESPNVVNDPDLNRQLYQKKLSRLTLGKWVEILFLALKAYEGKRNIFFIQELYDLYWDEIVKNRQPGNIQNPFNDQVEWRNNLIHNPEPKTEKGWQKEATEGLQNMRKIMRSLGFLKNYDLIRVIAAETGKCEYEKFTGQHPSRHYQVLAGGNALEIGRFYLSRSDHLLLELHPLLILSVTQEVKDWIPDNDFNDHDVAIFNALFSDTVVYISTVIQEAIQKHDETLISQLKNLIFYNLQQIKMARSKEKLSWNAIRDAAKNIGLEKINSTFTEDDQSPYLERQSISTKFMDFLKSRENCLVLTGKSGVGKSSFIHSLQQKFSQDENIAMFIYDGGQFDSPESITEMIMTDLETTIRLQGKDLGKLFQEVNAHEEMTNRYMILVFDAINENANPRDLFQKIDQIVKRNRFPWLKLIITSRPETWRAIKRGISFAKECYYCESSSERKESGTDKYSLRMEAFDRDELARVFEKYRSAYHIETNFLDLHAPIRNLLRDPLILRLMAEIYRGKKIPDNIQVNDIYKLYIDHLLESERLLQRDIDFLEQELMSRMIQPGSYANKLTAAEIQLAKTSDGRPLWELIHNEEMLNAHERINDSYIRLKDAELIEEIGSGLEYVVEFKHERFYEFFGGNRLYVVGKSVPEKTSFYMDVANCLNMKVFLWGAFVQAIYRELNEGNFQIFEALVEKDESNRLLRSALEEALVRLERKDPFKAKGYIQSLLGNLAPAPRTLLGELWRILRPKKDDSLHLPPTKIVAIETAARVRMTDILEQTAMQPSPKLRNLAAQNIFYLWKEDHRTGLEILDRLSYQVRGRHGLPDLSTAESTLAITGAMLGIEHKDPETLASLATIGRRALRIILYLDDAKQRSGFFSRIRRNLVGLLYNLVIGAMMKFVLRTLGAFGEHTHSSLREFNHFYQLSSTQRRLVQTFIPFLDYDRPGLDQKVQEMIDIEEWGDTMSDAITSFCMIGHGVYNFEETLGIVKKLLEFSLSCDPPRFWTVVPIWNLCQSAARIDKPNPELLELVDRTIVAIQNNSRNWVDQAKKDRPIPISGENLASPFLSGLFAYSIINRSTEVPVLIKKYLNRTLSENNEKYLEDFISLELTPLFEMGHHHVVIEGLKSVASCRSEKIQQLIVNILVRARNYDPEEIEDQLLRGEFPPEITERVFASPTVERLTDLLTFQLINIIYDLFILGPQNLRDEIKWLLYQSTLVKNFQDFIVVTLREVFNVLLGEVVFNVPKDAPSRLSLQKKIAG